MQGWPVLNDTAHKVNYSTPQQPNCPNNKKCFEPLAKLKMFTYLYHGVREPQQKKCAVFA